MSELISINWRPDFLANNLDKSRLEVIGLYFVLGGLR